MEAQEATVETFHTESQMRQFKFHLAVAQGTWKPLAYDPYKTYKGPLIVPEPIQRDSVWLQPQVFATIGFMPPVLEEQEGMTVPAEALDEPQTPADYQAKIDEVWQELRASLGTLRRNMGSGTVTLVSSPSEQVPLGTH